MKSIALEDIKLRVFVDTNILIDCFVTPEPTVINFVKNASASDLIDLVTSDYALWEQNEFIRKQTWIRALVSNQKSHNEALTYKLKLTDSLRQEVSDNIANAKTDREMLSILNYNLMDEATPNGDFFTRLELLTINSTISNQDLLILLSAYVTKSAAILSKDGRFNSSLMEIASLEETLGSSLLPETLKSIKFINSLDKNPQQNYNEWFENRFKDLHIAECICYYQKVNIVCAECIGNENINIGDYLLLTKNSKNNEFKRVVFRVNENCLRDYDNGTDIPSGRKVTIKMPNEISVERWMDGGKIFRIENS